MQRCRCDDFGSRRFGRPPKLLSNAPQVGYSGSITIGALTVWTCLEREAQLSQQLRLARKVSDAAQAHHSAVWFAILHLIANSWIVSCATYVLQASDPVKAADNIERQLRLLRAKRFLKSLAIVQDLADTLLAVNDVRGGLFSTCLRVWHGRRHT